MTPEIARIIRNFSPQERATYVAAGGRIPACTPKPCVRRPKNVFAVWEKPVKKGKAA